MCTVSKICVLVLVLPASESLARWGPNKGQGGKTCRRTKSNESDRLAPVRI